MIVTFRPRPHGRRILRWLAMLVGTGVVAGGMFGLGLYAYMSRDIPDFRRLTDYEPKVVSRVYGQEGQLIGEFYREKRVVLGYERIPRRLVQAFLASEDDRFFDHEGIDYFGILRAFQKNVMAGRVVQGGSTITQQVAKSLIISVEGYKKGTAKKYSRKLKEAILARRLEKRLSKEDILTLYLNQIFLGNQAYGVEAAAHNYYRKSVGEMNTAEMALLAGLPQAPSRYSPFRHPDRARKRREYVLRRMLEEGFITDEELVRAEATPITVFPAPNVSRDVTPYFTEHVRRLLLEKYGETAVLDEGLEVHTTVDVERYRGAEDAVYDKLRMVDKRQGFRGPLKQLSTNEEIETLLDKYSHELARMGRSKALKPGELYVGVVEKVDRAANVIYLRIGPHLAALPLAAMRWARSVNPQQWFESALLTGIPKSFKKGDVLHVRATTYDEIRRDRYSTPYLRQIPRKEGLALVALEQEPNLEAALMSTDVKSGYVLAMIGGYSFDRSEFNRAIQACRQPGSAFKPIVYAAALDLLGWTASTTVLDAPITYDDPSAGKRWKPKNFGTRFLGEVTLRTALQHSMNVPSIKVLKAVGLDEAIAYAKRLGIESNLPKELGLALGQGCVTMGNLAEVYRLFSSYGRRTPRRFITRVLDRNGTLLEDNTHYRDGWTGIDHKVERALTSSPAQQLIDRQTGYLITKMIRNVVNGGTGTPAQKLGVPVAGKTGTTNDSFDAWFVGYTTQIVTAAWVGYDDYVMPMGRYEQGGRAALPVWLAYMQRAIKQRKTGEFPRPKGVVTVRIDPKTGKLARPGTIGSVMEAYREGSEPKEFVAGVDDARIDEFGKEDI